MKTLDYVELHCHSHFSFKEGASSIDQIVTRARDLGYKSIALTDHDNMSGAMKFAQITRAIGVHGILGVEFTLLGGYHLTAIAENFEGYSNICRLLSLSNVFAERRKNPALDPRLFQEYSKGIIFMSGCKTGQIPQLLIRGDYNKAISEAAMYKDIFGSDNFFIELQQNFNLGDTDRNKKLIILANELNLNLVATNNVHYHIREYSHLNDCLVSIGLNQSLERTHIFRRPNSEYFLKSREEMIHIFRDYPEAILNTTSISERCVLDLTKDINYKFPDYSPPDGYTPVDYLRKLCNEAAIRRYGRITPEVYIRLEEEFRLINKHNLAGFLLYYYDIVQIAREVMIDLGLVDSEIPIEERPPGRSRGSSVALLIGYLIGLSHIDPLKYKLSLERFLPDDLLEVALDIDLDFPRNIRKDLIRAVHKRWGWERAALTGMVNTYQIRGAIRDLGKVLDIPKDQIDSLNKKVSQSGIENIKEEIESLPEFSRSTKHPAWRDLINLAPRLDGTPRYIAQHPGGMIISSTPLAGIVPIQKGAIEDRYVIQWDKDDIHSASIVKIDFLALGALSQLQDILHLIEKRKGHFIDISRIPHEDHKVYEMLAQGDTVGIFQIESAAQMQTIIRIKPRNLQDMAYEVACVRPGVGLHDGVRHFINRRIGNEPVVYDHILERRALERTLGIILYQDQVNQLAIDIGGFSPFEADQMRRAFGRKNNENIISIYRDQFLSGAYSKGISEDIAQKIFKKFNGYYMFPEAHAVAFGVTSYQLSWLKYYYTIEFMLALFNQQPMGFWNLETLKEDAKRHGVNVFNPDINFSSEECSIEIESIRLGLLSVNKIGPSLAENIIEERNIGGLYKSLSDFMKRTDCKRESIENLVLAGAFDSMKGDRRSLLWEVGLIYMPPSKQLSLDIPVDHDMAILPELTDWESMILEYKTLNLYPKNHFMAMLRPHLGEEFLNSRQLKLKGDGQFVKVAGVVARPLQHPLSEAYFITLEDEFGFIPLLIWRNFYEENKSKLHEHIMFVSGIVSQREGTLNIIVKDVIIP